MTQACIFVVGAFRQYFKRVYVFDLVVFRARFLSFFLGANEAAVVFVRFERRRRRESVWDCGHSHHTAHTQGVLHTIHHNESLR